MRVVFLLFLCSTGFLTAASLDWIQGKLVDLAISETPMKDGKPAKRKIFTFKVDGGDKVYEAQEVGTKPPRVEVNAPIQFAIHKDSLFVKDSNGKLQKLALLKTTRKE